MLWFAYFAGPEPLSNLIDYGVTDKSRTVQIFELFEIIGGSGLGRP